MKTIEQKAKAYDEALERYKAKQEYESKEVHKFIEYIFPELKDSEDERIKEDLIQWINAFPDTIWRGHYKKDVVAWLEKQGEQKLVDKVEPKFKNGQWIVFNGLTLYVKEVVKGFYRTVSKGGIHNSYDWDIDNVARLWTIQDAKDGDVLVDEEINVIGIFDGIEGMCWHSKFYYSNITKEFYGIECGGSHLKKFAKPATKEQRDTLMKVMADAEYTFDFEKKELRKIGHKLAWSKEDDYYHGIIQYILNNECVGKTDKENAIKWFNSLKDRVQPQPRQEWSEKDETALGDALWCCKQAASIAKDENDMGNVWYAEHWLKSLKDRYVLQPKHEWSEEDDIMVENIRNSFGLHCGQMTEALKKQYDKFFNKVKSLRPQSTWKPSELQIEALESATENCAYSEYQDCLRELIEQLKK